MPKTCLFSLLLLLVAAIANGQFVPARGMQNDTGKLYVRHSPMGLIDPFDGNLTIGAEYRFTSTWSATMDGGMILYSKYFWDSKGATGILLRPGARVYPGKYKDYYVEMQFHYKQVDYRIRDWLDREVVNGVATYQELKTFRYRKQVMGAHIIGGYKDGSKNRRFFIEAYLGIGIRIKDEFLHNEPNSRYDSPNSIGVTNNNTNSRINSAEEVPNERRVMPAVLIGIRLTYKLW